jgi:hypothetical protein
MNYDFAQLMHKGYMMKVNSSYMVFVIKCNPPYKVIISYYDSSSLQKIYPYYTTFQALAASFARIYWCCLSPKKP